MEGGKVALVSGANKGLGFETSRQLAQLGITVLMGARSVGRGKAAAKELQKAGLPVEFIRLDVTKKDQIDQAAAMIKKRFGRLDILVNNAGISEEEAGTQNSTETVSGNVLRRTFDTNFFGLVELTQKFLPLIRKSPAGRIVNVASGRPSVVRERNRNACTAMLHVLQARCSSRSMWTTYAWTSAEES